MEPVPLTYSCDDFDPSDLPSYTPYRCKCCRSTKRAGRRCDCCLYRAAMRYPFRCGSCDRGTNCMKILEEHAKVCTSEPSA